MKIKNIHIENFKSLANVNIENPAPFSVFVGPNASGKSNIFEAIEFGVAASQMESLDAIRLFGGISTILNQKQPDSLIFSVNLNDITSQMDMELSAGEVTSIQYTKFKLPESDDLKSRFSSKYWETPEYQHFFRNHSRIFISNRSEKISFNDDKKLSTACGNLERVLKRVLRDEIAKEEILEWLQLLVPSLKKIQIESHELSGTDSLLVFEDDSTKPYPKNLISDGTYNIIALLTAIYQSNEPQFLCIEEPENGLNPKVVKELVNFFRKQCEERGHYIWLNTHSQTLVRELTPEEIIIVDKTDGETRIKQIPGLNLHGLKMDEALLSGAIGGGIPW